MARVEIFKKVLPNLTKLAVLANKTYPGNEHLFSVIEATAKKLNVKVQAFDVSKPEDLEGAIASAKRDGADAVSTLQGPFFFIQKKLLAELAQKHKIPLAMGEVLSAEAGVMLQVNPDIPACAARSASFVDRILKGAKPGDLGDRALQSVPGRLQSQDGQGVGHKRRPRHQQSCQGHPVVRWGIRLANHTAGGVSEFGRLVSG